jgi:hypothetical protein
MPIRREVILLKCGEFERRSADLNQAHTFWTVLVEWFVLLAATAKGVHHGAACCRLYRIRSMRISPVLVISLLALPLGGCFGVMLPPQPLPDWAMSPQQQYDEPRADQAPRTPAKKQRVVRQHEPRALTSAQSELLTGSAGTRPDARAELPKPFAPGWDAREDERDASLRHTLNICRGC